MLTAVICFCLIMGSQVVPITNTPDVTVQVVTPARVQELAPMDFNTGDNGLVLVTQINAEGRAKGYRVLSGAGFAGAHAATGPDDLLQHFPTGHHVRQANGWASGSVLAANHGPRVVRLPLTPIPSLCISEPSARIQARARGRRSAASRDGRARGIGVPHRGFSDGAAGAQPRRARSRRETSCWNRMSNSSACWRQLMPRGTTRAWARAAPAARGKSCANTFKRRMLPFCPELKKFYAEHHVKDDPSQESGAVHFARSDGGLAAGFQAHGSRAELPPDARDVVGFLPLLRTFYAQTKMLIIWSHVQKQYEAAVARYTDAVRQDFVLTEAYMRFPAGGYLGRTYAIYIDLMGAPEQVHARIYGLNYYLVVTPSEDLKLEEIRFQYLHFLLDPLAAKYGAEIDQKSCLRTYAHARRPCWDWTSRRILVCSSRSA